MTSRTNERRLRWRRQQQRQWRHRRPVAAVYLHWPFRRCSLLFDVNVQTRGPGIWQSGEKQPCCRETGHSRTKNSVSWRLNIRVARCNSFATRSQLKYPVIFNIKHIYRKYPLLNPCVAKPRILFPIRQSRESESKVWSYFRSQYSLGTLKPVSASFHSIWHLMRFLPFKNAK